MSFDYLKMRNIFLRQLKMIGVKSDLEDLVQECFVYYLKNPKQNWKYVAINALRSFTNYNRDHKCSMDALCHNKKSADFIEDIVDENIYSHDSTAFITKETWATIVKDYFKFDEKIYDFFCSKVLKRKYNRSVLGKNNYKVRGLRTWQIKKYQRLAKLIVSQGSIASLK